MVNIELKHELRVFLTEYGVLTKFRRNAVEHRKRYNIKNHYPEDVWEGFLWSETKEGSEFWRELQDKYEWESVILEQIKLDGKLLDFLERKGLVLRYKRNLMRLQSRINHPEYALSFFSQIPTIEGTKFWKQSEKSYVGWKEKEPSKSNQIHY